MRTRIERYRRVKPAPPEDYQIGCVLLSQPFFFSREDWLPVPDWQPNIVRGKGYDLNVEPGLTLWNSILGRLRRLPTSIAEEPAVAEFPERYGMPNVVRPRLGQGLFLTRVMSPSRLSTMSK